MPAILALAVLAGCQAPQGAHAGDTNSEPTDSVPAAASNAAAAPGGLPGRPAAPPAMDDAPGQPQAGPPGPTQTPAPVVVPIPVTNPVANAGPPILIPGTFTGPAAADTELSLKVNLRPDTSATGIAQVKGVLTAAHMTVTGQTAGAIGFTATVEQVESMFGCRLDSYRLTDGTVHVAPVTVPRLPAALTRHAVSVTGFFLPGQRASGRR